MIEIGTSLIFTATLIIVSIAFVFFIAGIFRLTSYSKLDSHNSDKDSNLKYIFSAKIGKGNIVFATANANEIIKKIGCMYVPFEVSDIGVKPALNIPEEIITEKMVENLQYYKDTEQQFSVLYKTLGEKTILYSAFPFSYAFDEVEEEIKNLFTNIIIRAYEKECQKIAIPLFLTDKIHVGYDIYKRTIIEPVGTALQNTDITVLLFCENERLEWEIIDNL